MKNPNTSMLRASIVLAMVFVVIANEMQNSAEKNGTHEQTMTFNGQGDNAMDINLPNMQGGFLDYPTMRFMIRYNNMANQNTNAQGDDKMPDCMKRNSINSLRLFMMGITPKCDENGKLQYKQCFDHSDQCVCVRKNGSMINKPSSKVKGCQCFAKKYEVMTSGLIGGYAPQCEEDGTYKKTQCHYSTGYCYCADPLTGKNTTTPSREYVNCDAPSTPGAP